MILEPDIPHVISKSNVALPPPALDSIAVDSIEHQVN